MLAVTESSISLLLQLSAGVSELSVMTTAHLSLFYPITTAEYRNNELSFHEYYDEVEICTEAAEHHFKSAHQIRNRFMVDRSDLVVFCVGHNSGGAYQTMQYAKKANANIVNLSDVTH